MNRIFNRIFNIHSILCFLGVMGFLFLALPVLIVIPMSFVPGKYLQFPPPSLSLKWYRIFFTQPKWYGAALLSLRVAFFSCIISTIMGTLVAFGIARGNFPGKRILRNMFLAPLLVPVIITAVGVYIFFAKLNLLDSATGLILAHTAFIMPYVIFNVLSALSNLNPDMEKAAYTLGAGKFYTFWKVIIPQISPGIIAGALLAFMVSFDEPVIAIFLCGSEAITLPKQIFSGIKYNMDPTVAVSSTILIFTSFLVVTAAFQLKKFLKERSRIIGEENG